jgi:hypothetical protein
MSKYRPKQQKYSPSEVKNLSSPEGEAALNEELRRISAAAQAQASAQVAPQSSARQLASAQASSSPGQSQAQTPLIVLDDGRAVVPETTAIDFVDTATVTTSVSRDGKVARIRFNSAAFGGYTAKNVGEFLYSLDGSTFEPRWPLTSLETGIILDGNGIVMVV